MTLSEYAMAFLSSVRGPLDRLDVDPFLMHLPERRQRAEALDRLHDQIDDEVDLLLRVEPTDAEPDRRVGELLADAARAGDARRAPRAPPTCTPTPTTPRRP